MPPAQSLLDSVLNAFQRATLASQLVGKVRELQALPAGGGLAESLQRARLASQVNALVVQLTGASGTEGVLPDVAALIDIAEGRRDGEGLARIFDTMSGAIGRLDQDGQLLDEAEARAHDAITHWAKLEVSVNG